MRAYHLTTGPDLSALEPVELPEPVPGPGQVVVQVGAVSLNYRDLVIALGRGAGGSAPPVVPCSDGAGEVVAVGDGVTRVAAGDRVAGLFFQTWLDGPIRTSVHASALGGAIDGMLAERVCLDADGVVKLPAGYDAAEGATLPCAALTAWNAIVEEGGVSAGDTILLQGTGGVSIFGLQFAKALGCRVIITSSSDAKLEHAKTLGADATVNYREHPEWSRPVRDLCGGDGVDLVLEVGGAGTMEQSMKAARAGGRISLIGILAGANERTAIGPLMGKGLRMTGIYVGSRAMFEAMNRAIDVNGIRPVIDRSFPMDETVDAYRHLQAGAHFGKVAIAL